MSRSRRKTPITGVTGAASDKPFKKRSARTVRRVSKQKLQATQDGDALPHDRFQLVNQWACDKDGKTLIDPKSPLMRK